MKKFKDMHLSTNSFRFLPFLLILFCASLLFSSFISPIQNESINLAIKTGNANQLAGFMGKEIDLSIQGDNALLEKSAAIAKLNQFFMAHKPNNYVVLHQGQSAKGTNYSIGKLSCDNGDFRVSVYTKEVNGKLIIQQLNIEPN